MSEENVEVVRLVLDAYGRRDVEALRSLNHLDLELDWSESVGTLAGVYRGFEEALRFYNEYYETFESSVVVADRYIDVGDIVVVPNVVYQRGRDGIKVSARSTILFRVRGGKVSRVRLYQLEEDALKAAGLEN